MLKECGSKKCFYIFFAFACMQCGNQIFSASLDGRTTLFYENTPWTPSTGEYAVGYVTFNAGFVIPNSASVSVDVLIPVSGDIDLGGTGILVLDGDLNLSSDANITQGGTISGQGNVIFLKADLIVPAGQAVIFSSDTVIDGLGHNIIFEEGAYFKIDGPVSTNLTLKNCALVGVQDDGPIRSIIFGSSVNQKLVLNNVVLNLANDFTFVGGGLEIQNFVRIKGYEKYFIFESNYDLIVNKYSTLFIDTNVVFEYAPSDLGLSHIKMEDNSSELFMNGCYVYFPAANGLQLIKGHLLVDHEVGIYCDGTEKPNFALTLGNCKRADNLAIDIFPAANFNIVTGGLIYSNIDDKLFQ